MTAGSSMSGGGAGACGGTGELLPRLSIHARRGMAGCTATAECSEFECILHSRHIGRYIARNEPFAEQIVAAHIDLRGLSFDQYEKRVRRLHKGNSVREAAKAARLGYICEPFPMPLHIPDIVAINHSKPVRCGRPMTEQYRRSVDELGGEPQTMMDLAAPACPRHYDYWWGAFREMPGHRQGAVTTDRQLIAYICLRRIGNYMLYAKILGHGDHLSSGVMYQLHYTIMRWLTARDDQLTGDLDYLIYAGMYQGKEGLQHWKKKLAFAPALMVLGDDDSPRDQP